LLQFNFGLKAFESLTFKLKCLFEKLENSFYNPYCFWPKLPSGPTHFSFKTFASAQLPGIPWPSSQPPRPSFGPPGSSPTSSYPMPPPLPQPCRCTVGHHRPSSLAHEQVKRSAIPPPSIPTPNRRRPDSLPQPPPPIIFENR
jgi:hypothetical protein